MTEKTPKTPRTRPETAHDAESDPRPAPPRPEKKPAVRRVTVAKRRKGHPVLKTLALASVAGAAALAVARRAGRDVPPLYRSLRATPHDYSWGGHRVVYYESDPTSRPADAPPLVLVHSIHAAASAWEMRELFRRFAGDYRVLAVDLLGFGASDRPDADYDADLYRELLGDFLRDVAGAPAHVYASSLSGAHALGLAGASPALVRSLVLANPTGLLTQAAGQKRRGRILQTVFRLPWLGEALFNALVSRRSLRWYAGKLYTSDDAVGPEATEQRYATAHQPGARYAPAAFLGNGLAENVYMALRTLEVPALAIWSGTGEVIDVEREREAFTAVAPGVRRVTIEECGAVPHEERPDEVEAAVRGFLATV